MPEAASLLEPVARNRDSLIEEWRPGVRPVGHVGRSCWMLAAQAFLHQGEVHLRNIESL